MDLIESGAGAKMFIHSSFFAHSFCLQNFHSWQVFMIKVQCPERLNRLELYTPYIHTQ